MRLAVRWLEQQQLVTVHCSEVELRKKVRLWINFFTYRRIQLYSFSQAERVLLCWYCIVSHRLSSFCVRWMMGTKSLPAYPQVLDHLLQVGGRERVVLCHILLFLRTHLHFLFLSTSSTPACLALSNVVTQCMMNTKCVSYLTLDITGNACVLCCKGYLQHWRSCVKFFSIFM